VGNKTYDRPEVASEDLSRPLCDQCCELYADREWNGRLLCPQCLEEELENDHTIPRAD